MSSSPRASRAPVADLPGPRALRRASRRARLGAARHELALDTGPQRAFVNVSVTRDDKEALEAVQAWYSFREGRRVPHWELFNLILAEALQNEKGRFFRMTQRSWV